MVTKTRPSAAITGELGEVLVKAALIRQGWIVCTPEGHSSPFDLVALKGDRVVRVQVKSTARDLGGHYRVCVTRRRPGRETAPYGAEVDIFACVCTSTETVAFIPADKVKEGAGSVSVTSRGGGRGSFLIDDVRAIHPPQQPSSV